MTTEYVWVTEQCNVCNYGKVNCSQCAGSSQINCSLCRATGNLTCNSCSGQGYISCISCEGSGLTGEAHWADVHISSEYKLTLSENPYDESIEILSKESVHGLVPLAAGFAFEQLFVSGHLNSQVTAYYKGYFSVYRLEANCNGKDYSIVAYGKDFKWLTLANLIEDLVVNDIKKLQKVLLESIGQHIFNNETDALLTATKNVIASEVNTDLIDADFSSKTEQASEMFSTEFASNVKSNIKGAIKLIFIRFARKFWWKLSLAIPLIYFVAWFWGEKYLGIFTSLVAIVTGWLLFRHQTSKKLASSTIEKKHAQWMLDAAKRTGSDRIANAIVVLPSLTILISLVAILPPHSFLKNQAIDIDSSIHVIPESPGTPQVLESKKLPEETSLEADKHEPDSTVTVPGQHNSSHQPGDKKRKNSARPQESLFKAHPDHPAAEDDPSIQKEIGVFPSEQIPTTHKTESTDPSLEPNNPNEHSNEISKAVEKYTGLKVRPMTQEEMDNRKKNCPIPGQC